MIDTLYSSWLSALKERDAYYQSVTEWSESATERYNQLAAASDNLYYQYLAVRRGETLETVKGRAMEIMHSRYD